MKNQRESEDRRLDRLACFCGEFGSKIVSSAKDPIMTSSLTTTDLIATKIVFVREEKVLLDFDLAFLYGVKNKRLKESVRRNIDRFPKDFMFVLTAEEWRSLRTQIASLKKSRGKHPKY
ncbi:MAG TPA: ORF6N domain-containing protein, partial [Chryseosolibacter sp.]|nr:ORF6N domain-containing protein [Chryseosolibacter sp.]